MREALEMYHSLKRSDRTTVQTSQRWLYMKQRNIFSHIGSAPGFFSYCMRILKTMEHVHKKSKEDKPNRSQWKEKLNAYLALPFHDTLNAFAVSGKYRAFEHPTESGVAVLCLNCPSIGCPGCYEYKVAPPRPQTSGLANNMGYNLSPSVTITKAPIKVRGPYLGKKIGPTKTQLSNSSSDQRTYFKKVGIWKTQDELNREFDRVRRLIGRTPMNLTELIELSTSHKIFKRPGAKLPSENQLKYGTAKQLAYFNLTNVWRTPKQLKKDCAKAAVVLGLNRPLKAKELAEYHTGKRRLERRKRGRRPGRPPASSYDRAPYAAGIGQSSSTENGGPRRRGRPPKIRNPYMSMAPKKEPSLVVIPIPMESSSTKTEQSWTVSSEETDSANNPLGDVDEKERKVGDVVEVKEEAEEKNGGNDYEVDDDEVCILPD